MQPRTIAPLMGIAILVGLPMEGQPDNRTPRQQSDRSQEIVSRIENFTNRQDKILVSERHLAEKIVDDHGDTRLEFWAVVLYDAGKRVERLKGVEVRIERGSGKLPGSIILDLEAASGAARAVAQIKPLSSELLQKETPTSAYTSQYSISNKFTIKISKQEVFIALPETITTIPMESLSKVYDALESAIKLAKSK